MNSFLAESFDKKLCYRREAARRNVSWILVNCCAAHENVTFGKACSKWMTLKATQVHPNCRYSVGHISLPTSGL